MKRQTFEMSSKFSSYCPPNSARIGDLKGRIRWIRSLSFLGRHTGRPLKAEVRYRNVEKVAERKPMKRIMALARVLTLQSHVVHGYVGNRCAAFCLQRLGIETDILHTVQFSNRKGYPALTGDVFSAQQIENLYSGLQQNHLDRHTHVLTGYLGSKEVLQSVAKIIKQAKMRCPDLIYLCDPVMGDDGKLYLPKEMVEAYRSEIVPLAQILVPNLSEVEFLLEREIHDLEMLDAACSELHAMGPSTVVRFSFLKGRFCALDCDQCERSDGAGFAFDDFRKHDRTTIDRSCDEIYNSRSANGRNVSRHGRLVCCVSFGSFDRQNKTVGLDLRTSPLPFGCFAQTY